jgi:hypothetical protein
MKRQRLYRSNLAELAKLSVKLIDWFAKFAGRRLDTAGTS